MTEYVHMYVYPVDDYAFKKFFGISFVQAQQANYKANVDDRGKSDAEKAKLQWMIHKKANDSIIVDMFQVRTSVHVCTYTGFTIQVPVCDSVCGLRSYNCCLYNLLHG